MYPGTYQPLEMVSLLLADLLSFPQSEEAATSAGLVDAIFQLYQSSRVVTEASNPLRGKLSPSRREVWSSLVHMRKKALERMDQDPCALRPCSMASSHRCICGARIGHEQLMLDAGEQGSPSLAGGNIV